MIKLTLSIMQKMLQDFKSVSDHFGRLCITELGTGTMSIKSGVVDTQID